MAELDAVKVTRYSNNVYTMAQQNGSDTELHHQLESDPGGEIERLLKFEYIRCILMETVGDSGLSESLE